MTATRTPTDPEFSVLVRTRDRLESLRRTLDSLDRLDYPHDSFEIIVVDDGSRDGTTDWLTERAKRADPPIRVLHQPPLGLASANNAALRAARGRILPFIDDDCTVRPDWLCRLHDAAEHRPGAVLCGARRNACPENWYSEITLFLVNTMQETSLRSRGEPAFAFTANTAYPASAAARVGDFDERYNGSAAEERDWNLRLQADGVEFLEVPDLFMEHHDGLTWARFWSSHVRYGRGAAIFYHAHPSIHRRATGTLSLLLRATWRCYRFPQSLVMTLLLLASQAATLLGYLAEMWQPRRRRPVGDQSRSSSER